MYGYGQLPDPGTLAAQACSAMGGQWSSEAMECRVGDQVFQLPDFNPGAMPTGQCPPDQVKTPKGCFPYPGGVVNGNGNGKPPVVNGNGPAPPPQTKTETPSWLIPAVVGVGAIALIALVAK